MIVQNDKGVQYPITKRIYPCGDSFLRENARKLIIPLNQFSTILTLGDIYRYKEMVEQIGVKFKKNDKNITFTCENTITLKFIFKLSRYFRSPFHISIFNNIYDMHTKDNIDLGNAILIAHYSINYRNTAYSNTGDLVYFSYKPRFLSIKELKEYLEKPEDNSIWKIYSIYNSHYYEDFDISKAGRKLKKLSKAKDVEQIKEMLKI